MTDLPRTGEIGEEMTEHIREKEKFYQELLEEGSALIQGERDWIANFSNISALLYQRLDNINWAGFYLLKEEQLVLGPFQGKPACIRIALGRGVCGTAAIERQSQVVEDVHAFPGHIACDSASNSEIVVPLIQEGKLIGVLDVDSPILHRFDQVDKKYLEELAGILLLGCDF